MFHATVEKLRNHDYDCLGAQALVDRASSGSGHVWRVAVVICIRHLCGVIAEER